MLHSRVVADFAVEQPGIAVAVVDIVARLSAGSVVHVEDEVQVRFAAPDLPGCPRGQSRLG